MILPQEIRTGVEAALADLGAGELRGAAAVGGGCISPTARLDAAAGSFFLKWDDAHLPPGLLAAEARGLRALTEAGEVRVPAVAAADPHGAWLLMEWLEPGSAPGAWERLGRELAALHRHTGSVFGHEADNFIGSLPQANDALEDWPTFWWERRLEPQLRQARDRGPLDDGDQRRFRALETRIGEVLAPGNDDGPSLLHGDLWNGNVHMTAEGPAIIDPSVYHGHREVDLAMARLFGGFGGDFFRAYQEAWPPASGAEVRRAVYQLYYLLVHVNLFGAGYVARTRQALGDAGV